MDIRTQSALLAAIVCLALGVAMLLRAGRPRVLTLYSVLALTVSGYHLSQFFSGLVAGAAEAWPARVVLGAHIIVGALVPSAALGFFLEFLRVSTQAERYGRRLAFFSVVLGLAVGATPLAELLWARVAVSVWVVGALSIPVSLLLARIRQSESRTERLRLAYLAIGFGASILFSSLEFLPRFGVPFPTLGPVISPLYLFFLSQTLLRLRLMDLHELLGKIASQAVLAVMLALLFAVLTAWVGPNPSLFLFNTIVAAFVMLILVEPLRTKVEEQVVAIFFRERYELLRSLGSLRARTANVIDVSEHAAMVLDAYIETRRVTHTSVYLLAEDRPGYRLLAHRGPQPATFLDTGTARGLLNAASSGQKAVLVEHLDRRIAELRLHSTEGKRVRDELKRLNDTKVAMQQMKAGITVPLVGNDRVIGFVNLWDERMPEAYASDEIALILEISEQLATVVENSKLYDRMRERDRLAALGEMSAGLAHEIRNPLGAIKGAAQCLDPTRLPGEDGEFLEVIVEEVNRLNGVVTAFLDYARPLKQNFGATDLNEVVTRTMRLIQNDVPKHIELSVALSDTISKVSADAEQLKQVLINLVQNATQAIGSKGGTITVKTARPERFSELRGVEYAELHVTDTGPGIPADQQLNIFVPFFTTKQKGTGLGLAICQRIVKNHGGTISVQSRPNEGTTFVIRLPALGPEIPSETPAPEGTPLPASLQLPEATGPSSVPTPDQGPKKKERKKRSAI
ncbi:MAG: ATP-binding protein [Myxococcota bacterium]